MNAAEGAPVPPPSGLKTVLRYTGIPPSWLDKRPKLPSRNWLIFSLLAEEPVSSLYRPRKVTVYGGKWPGDEDHDQTLKYFRKYVKPILVAAAVDYVMIGGKRMGDIANRVADDIKTRRRLETGLDSAPDVFKQLPTYRTPAEEGQAERHGGIVIIGRPTFKEFMAGLKRGWTEPLAKVDKDELLAQELEMDGHFDEDDDPERTSSPPPALSSAYPTTPQPQAPIPPLPPLLLVPFTDHLGFKQIPIMIWQFFNKRHDVRTGAEAAYRIVMNYTRPFSPPSSAPEALFSDITTPPTTSSDSDNTKAREKYYTELKEKLATARALARGTREPTKDEVRTPPPTEVELRAERLKKEKRWRGDLLGWQIIAPTTPVAWDQRFHDALSVFVDPPPGAEPPTSSARDVDL
ncbi:inner membrane protein import complex subunit Tim54-domain-containing protein [Mycena rebaudengoi]|nr:inner membrane protein import complex subunit Tim54-domain-containing protein [Mycena rebaudengoi]